MANRVVSLDELFTATPIIKLGKKDVAYADLNSREEATVMRVWNDGCTILGMAAPNWASLLRNQGADFVRWAGCFKAIYDEQPIQQPGGPGRITVDWLIPENVRITSATAGSSYVGYTINTWNISTTAATMFYILGSASGKYYGTTTAGSETGFVIAKDGIAWVGVTPYVTNYLLTSDADSQYTPWTVLPTYEIPTEDGKSLYVQPTPGMIPAMNDLGVQITFMPRTTGTAHIVLAGLSFTQYAGFNTNVTRA